MDEEINNNSWEGLQANLHPELIRSLTRNGFINTMPVQEAAVPLMVKNYDLAV